ncbi:MAG: OmpA family protein [Bacteroidales bacterium]|nr:OmpA family protein [Bacteroidales bacterium]
MKKSLILLFIISSSLFGVYGQEKGFHLGITGNVGPSYIRYQLDGKHNSAHPAGGMAGLNLQYFFNTHWGVSLGFDFASYSSSNTFSTDWNRDPRRYETVDMIDDGRTPTDDGMPSGKNENYNLHIRLTDWKETQQTYALNIPITVNFQQKWGSQELVGMYAAVGFKLQFPVLNPKYRVTDGTLYVEAYYPGRNLTIPAQDDPYFNNHGLGTLQNPNMNGSVKLRSFSLAATAEAGLLVSLSRRVDLAVGAFVDYGMTSLKNGNTNADHYGALFAPTSNEALNGLTEQDLIGTGLQYSGFLNSDHVGKTTLVAFGAKLSLRIKFGQLKDLTENDNKKMLENLLDKYRAESGGGRDTVIVNVNVTKDTILFNFPEWFTNSNAFPKNSDPNYLKNQYKTAEYALNESVFFDLDKYDLRQKSIEVLDRKIEFMKRYPNLTVSLIGHTCELAGLEYNYKLSINRCNSVRAYMIKHGIEATRIHIIPLGKIAHEYPNNTETERQLNRRVDFLITE